MDCLKRIPEINKKVCMKLTEYKHSNQINHAVKVYLDSDIER